MGGVGTKVVVTGRDGERGRAVVGEISGAGGEAIFVGHDLEAAILLTLPPGAYTAVVSGAGGATGVGLVEVYVVP